MGCDARLGTIAKMEALRCSYIGCEEGRSDGGKTMQMVGTCSGWKTYGVLRKETMAAIWMSQDGKREGRVELSINCGTCYSGGKILCLSLSCINAN